MTNTNPIDGLYSLSGEKSSDAHTSHKQRNAFLAGFLATESALGIAKVMGIEVQPVMFGAAAFATLMPAGMCELSRRISLRMSRDFREGARGLVELDMVTDQPGWDQTLSEPRNTKPPTTG